MSGAGTAQDIAARLVVAVMAMIETPIGDVATEPVASVSGGGPWSRATVDVEARWWRAVVRAARDDLQCDLFDWLSAVEEPGPLGTDVDGGYRIVTHLWSIAGRYGVLLRAEVPRTHPVIDSVVDLYPGAAWHERETAEMFGVRFAGHPDPRPLLLADASGRHPLRKDHPLITREERQWPGAVEPGQRSGARP